MKILLDKIKNSEYKESIESEDVILLFLHFTVFLFHLTV